MNWPDAFEILKPIPTFDYPGGPWPMIRYHKMRAWFELAKEVEDGCIVELGAWRGLGTCALALGAREGVEVVAVDDYAPKRDHLGYLYGPADAGFFYANVEQAGVRDKVRLRVGDVTALAQFWRTPIALCVWDLGIDRLKQDFEAWAPYIIPGGVFAAKDLETGAFGHAHLSEYPGWEGHRAFPQGCVFAVRKRGGDGSESVVDRDARVHERGGTERF